MTPEQVTNVMKYRLAKDPDFTGLSVHTQSALGGRVNVCTIIVGNDSRKRLKVVRLIEEGVHSSWITNTASGAVVVSVPANWYLR